MLTPLLSLLAQSTDEGQDLGGNITGLGGYLPGEENTGGPEQVANLFSNIFGFLTIVAGLMFFLYFIIGALNWLMAGGDEQRAEKAKKSLTDAAIGLIVVVVAYAVAYIVGQVLGFQVLDPAAELIKIMPGGTSSP